MVDASRFLRPSRASAILSLIGGMVVIRILVLLLALACGATNAQVVPDVTEDGLVLSSYQTQRKLKT
jgi:hypothetical protein